MLHKSEHPLPIVNNIRKRPECLLLALSGHGDHVQRCPLSGVKRTSRWEPLVFVSLTPEEIEAIRKAIPELTISQVGSGVYASLDKTDTTVGLYTLRLAELQSRLKQPARPCRNLRSHRSVPGVYTSLDKTYSPGRSARRIGLPWRCHQDVRGSRQGLAQPDRQRT